MINPSRKLRHRLAAADDVAGLVFPLEEVRHFHPGALAAAQLDDGRELRVIGLQHEPHAAQHVVVDH